MIQNYLIVFAVSAAISFSAAWKVQDWRFSDKISDIKTVLAEQRTNAVNKARSEEKVRYERVSNAQLAANDRAKGLEVDFANARTESNGLRDELAAIKGRVSVCPTATTNDRTGILADILGDCSEEYRGMAKAADKHESDARTLIQSWP